MSTKFINTLIFFLVTTAINAQTLDEYLKIAEENNDQLKMQGFEHKKALEKMVEMGSVPKTTIEAGVFVQEPETRVGAQKARFNINQPLPWFGTLKAQKESEQFKAYAALNRIDASKRQLSLQVKKMYYQLYQLNKQQAILRESIEVLDSYKDLAVAGLANNRSTLVEVLKIKVERNNVWNQFKEITRNLDSKKEIFNLLLSRKTNEYIEIPDKIDLGKLKSNDETTLNENPKLLEIDNTYKALLKQSEAIKKQGFPEIKLGLSYIPVQEISNVSIPDNGKDIIMPSVGVSLPIFSKKYDSKLKQVSLEQEAVKASKKNLEKELLMYYQEAKTDKDNIIESLRIKYENLEQIKEVQKVLLTIYPTAEIDFDKVLEVHQLKLKYELEIVVLEKDYAVSNAVLEALTTSTY